nr:hypothetical protein [Tanacetum cinerariifolium]
MVAYLTKSDASEGFNQIIDFLNGSSITYALTVNLNIYVSCIKQFLTTVAVKKVNDVTSLQALVDKKKVVVTEATIIDALRLDDAKGVECLPNEEIFAELARMGYEKPSTKLTFYKAFFLSQWKFLIHTILQCMSAKRTSWNEFSFSMASAVIYLSSGRKFNFSKYIFDSLVRNVDRPTKFYMYPRFLPLMIRKQVGNLSTHTTKYTSPALTQKVFANMRRVGKGFSRVKTLLFEGIAANDEVHTADEEPSIPSSTPPTPPPQPSHDIPSTSQEVMDTSTALIRGVEHLKLDKIAQALEITKLKRRVKKLEKRNKVKVLKLKRLQKVGTAQRIDTSDDTVMDDVSNQGRMIADMDVDADVVLEEAKDGAADPKDDQDADVQVNADIQGRIAESQAKIYKIDLDHAKKYNITAADVPIPAATTAAALKLIVAPSRRTKGVVIRDPEESTTTTSTIIHSEAKSKDKGKGILVEEPKPLKKQAQIKQDEKYARELEAELNKTIYWDKVIDHVNKKVKEDKSVKRYQAMKRKPQTKTQVRRNMMVYLKNVASFKMDYFKGMTYDDIRLVFEKHFDSNVAFLQKIKEQIDEEENRALKRINETPAEKAAKRQKLNEEKLPHLLEREDLEALWSLVKERFATTKPKIFFDDFLLMTLGAMFEKPDIHAQIWKNQISVHAQPKVKSWKLLESCGVQIIIFTTTQLILLVERKYPLIRFTLDQMLNNVRLEVKRRVNFGVDVAMDFKEKHAKCLMLLAKDLVLSSQVDAVD